MLALANLSKFHGEQTLFEGVSVQLKPGQRYGVVGANGSGKSTLLQIISGEEPASDGTVSRPKTSRLGVLRQDHYRYEGDRILDVVMMGNATLWDAIVEKESLLDKAEESFDAERYSKLEDIIVGHDGYALEARAAEILEGLGIPAKRHREPLSALSGGFKLRALLAQVLAADPDILLLDEPTNHLDILSIRWLEKFLDNTEGLSLVVSHDHRFLDNVCTSILDVDYDTILHYPGNYSAFAKAKAEERARREHEISKRQKEIDQHQAFVDRFRAKATKARQAQSKIKLIERIVIDDLPRSSRRYPTFSFRQIRPSGKQVIEAQGISKSYNDQTVLKDVDLQVRRGERIAILGPNGIGKSTLLKILVSAIEADAGEVEWGYETHVGYFAQDHKEQLQDRRKTVEDWLWEVAPGEPIGFVRAQLAAVLFSAEEGKKKVGSLSGGEAARLIFCRHVVERPNVLVLDEPTNHLDLEAIEALVKGLRSFEGTLILVSHDRWFVSQLATRIIEISEQGLLDFPGTYEEFLQDCGDDHLDSDAVLRRARRQRRESKKEERSKLRPGDQDQKLRHRRLRADLELITHEIEQNEARVHAINESFCDPAFYEQHSPKEVGKLEREQKTIKQRIDELMIDWERIEHEIAS